LPAQVGDRGRQLARARRRLAEPERDRRRRAAGVLDVYAPGPDAPDAPGAVAEEEDVARHALDGEVLVDGADLQSLRLLHHLVVGSVGNGASARDRGEPGAAARTEAAMHAVE